MMYHMKKIIDHDKEIFLPNCMYSVKYRTDLFQEDYSDSDIGISAQGSNKMTELEQRQEQLLKKLDTLYDRIKTISTYCKVDNIQETKISKPDKCLPAPEEVVLVLSPDNWPWYLNLILKKPIDLNISWHIHSSVPNDKVAKIKNYVKNLQETKSNSTINLRLIFKCVSADTELKISTLDVPIVGNVNILRYLSYVYPSVIPYNTNDHQVEALLDICHLLERASDKNKEALVKKLFANEKNWINGSEFSIVDVAAYNVIKQWKNVPNYISKPWFEKTNKLFL
ncbi:hypothetical protein SFRURICE_009080 [Spodoptera frugiperda]|uniref:SFRICE_001023 n=1 Tax=Spodoptera frugiperda TaxID=7108 RepID=A0A2H1W975_SPOFR|nr:hypothetical protein SFRURICE_009080 [Spodoptera frugiperda]